MTQCSYFGWFDADKWDAKSAVTSRKRVFRQCRLTATQTGGGRCHLHKGVQDGDRNDPDELAPPPDKKERRRRGLDPSDIPGAQDLTGN